MIIVDATLAVKLLVAEPNSSASLARIADEGGLIVPDWLRVVLTHDKEFAAAARLVGRSSHVELLA